jgi:signal transduction histidine kinase
VAARERTQPFPLGVEIALAFTAGAAAFAVAAVVFDGVDSDVVVVFIGAIYLASVVAVAQVVGIAYAVPVGMAGILAYDWYYLAPTHPLEVPDSANLVHLIVYLGVAVLLGELAAHAARRAEGAERARGEIADEQSALRRVATLVARGAPAPELFAAVAAEAGILLDVHGTRIARYQGETELLHIAEWSKPGYQPPPAYGRAPLEGTSVSGEVLRTGRAARIDSYQDIAARGAFARDPELESVVGAPIVVEGRRWGVMIAWSRRGPLPSHTEDRLTDFAELVATAISNTEARSELAASRARVVAASDDERRRVVRDLHDGAQQRLVHTLLTLKLARRALAKDGEAATLVDEGLQEAEAAMADLRELAHGILPSVLTKGGLAAALPALATRMPVPVDVDVSVGRLPAGVEATAYFVVAEALTNVAKHARAGSAAVTADLENRALRLEVRDDGVGGARPDGSGLVGLADRLAVLDGQLRVESPAEGGTLVAASLPVPS